MKPCALAAVLLCFALSARSGSAGDPHALTRQLARQLVEDGSFGAAAVEYRRLALSAEQPDHRAAYYWAAAYAYWRNGEPERTAAMLDRAEQDSTRVSAESLLLRAESSLAARKPDAATFYLRTLLAGPTPGLSTGFLRRRMAHATLRSTRSAAQAIEWLDAAPGLRDRAVASLRSYASGRDKSPRLGGLLGIVPGLGYAYSGEFANALRSFILNGLFLFAMVDTAENDQWGAFAALSFFELTWYSGSIYGGADAAHRYNRRRLDRCLEAVDEGAGFHPDLGALPLLTLRFER